MRVLRFRTIEKSIPVDWKLFVQCQLLGWKPQVHFTVNQVLSEWSYRLEEFILETFRLANMVSDDDRAKQGTQLSLIKESYIIKEPQKYN